MDFTVGELKIEYCFAKTYMYLNSDYFHHVGKYLIEMKI